MRRLVLVVLGLLAAGTLGGCRSGCPRSGYAPCTFTYEVDSVCRRTYRPFPVAPEVVRPQP